MASRIVVSAFVWAHFPSSTSRLFRFDKRHAWGGGAIGHDQRGDPSLRGEQADRLFPRGSLLRWLPKLRLREEASVYQTRADQRSPQPQKPEEHSGLLPGVLGGDGKEDVGHRQFAAQLETQSKPLCQCLVRPPDNGSKDCTKNSAGPGGHLQLAMPAGNQILV